MLLHATLVPFVHPKYTQCMYLYMHVMFYSTWLHICIYIYTYSTCIQCKVQYHTYICICFTVHVYSARCNIIRTYVYVLQYMYTVQEAISYVHMYMFYSTCIQCKVQYYTYICICFTVHVYTGPTGVVESPFCWTLTLVKMIAGAGILACPPRNSDHRKPPTKDSRLKTSTSTDSFEWLS